MTGPEQLDDPRSDAGLLAAHVGGDADAFAELFRRHRDRLWGVALRTCGQPEEAADALQDAMIAAYTRAGGFRGDAAVTTWLHRIVVNACLDRIRRARIRRAEPLPDDLDQLPHEPVPTAGEVRGPEAQAIATDQRRVLLDALAGLSPEHREALVLVDVEGLPVAEAARILGCPVGTVKSRCARGRARLVVLLEGTGLRPETSNRSPSESGGGRS